MKSVNAAIEDFFAARRQAFIQEIIGRLTGKPTRLLAYEEVREKLRAGGAEACGVREIPIDAIVGSVGRYNDFSRSFLPLHDKDRQRWSRVNVAMNDLAGVPPVEVYQVGQAYFVMDGNHRVSVARQLGATHIQARVTEVQTRVPLSPDDNPDALIIKSEYAAFLELTRLDELRPKSDLILTIPGQYRLLADHIQVHRHFMSAQEQREVPIPEAAGDWYDTEYLPGVRIIRRRNLLREFPGRTETDLFLWIAEHRAALTENLGWQIQGEAAAANWVRGAPVSLSGRIVRVTEQLREIGPMVGRWRGEQLPPEVCDCLFADILVPVSGDAQSWHAVDQAINVVNCEQARLLGLHVAGSRAEAEAKPPQFVQAEFLRRCHKAGVPAQFAVEVGVEARVMARRARWADLVVAPIPRRPGTSPLARLDPAFPDLVRHCPTPILGVPSSAIPFARAVLAYDGSATAREALYVTAYLAEQWAVPVVIVVANEDLSVARAVGEQAMEYLGAHQVSASLLGRTGAAATEILRVAEEEKASLIILGAETPRLLPQPASGRVADAVLRSSLQPVLICR